jgi:4a-hydroxytetrahydrobiopterin dehydratase
MRSGPPIRIIGSGVAIRPRETPEEASMAVQTADQLREGKCKPCEGGVEKMSPNEATRQLGQLQGWELGSDQTSIHKNWNKKHFRDAMAFLNRIAEIAETEQHHPDLHLTGYRKVRVALTTHAIGGLSENDFILAAKIDEVA